MAARKPAVSTLLKQANERIASLQKELDSAKSMRDLYMKNQEAARAEVEQIHSVLDALPNAPGRKNDHEDQWQRVERTAVTRLAAYFATKH